MRNDSFSLRFYLNTDKKRIDGVFPIYLRITVNRKKTEISTRLTIKKETDWDPEMCRVKTRTPINSQLSQIEGDMNNLYLQLKHSEKPISAEILKDTFLGRGLKNSLLKKFLQTEVAEQILNKPEFSTSTKHIYLKMISYLNEFLAETSQTKITLPEMNDSFIRKWDAFLISKPFLKRNTVNKYHTKLKAILNLAVEERLIERTPYSKFKIKNEPTSRTYLTKPELERIENHNLGENISLERVRDKFLFSVYSGLRFQDADCLLGDNIEFDGNKYWIVLIQQKTQEYLRIPLLNKAKEIYDKYEAERIVSGYVLPRISNQKLNAYLKVIANFAGIKKPLTHHVARHTAATTIFLANGVPLEIVSKQLGHSSIKTTQIYAKITNEMLSKAADKLDEIFK